MAKKSNKKHVYKVTFYYHSNCEVIVTSDEELSRKEAVDKAYGQVEKAKYKEQINNGIQEVDTPDFAEMDVRDCAFDKNDRIITANDNVIVYDHTYNIWSAAVVCRVEGEGKGARVLVSNEKMIYSVNPKDCIVYD